ncbi:MAG: hydantoinase B/oxoprolinase family protein [Gammaproteobacteria bacterium]|nr:hydantoinase B/oxoprolinase family protein [Gammaproteobacteria bacterium]
MNAASTIATIDPIRVSVIDNRLDAICREIGLTMLRTSRSPIFSEARDFVTGIFDRDLRLVAQTAYIPVLMGALPYAIRSIAATFADDIREGDVFILNDPYRGNNHPPDITIAKPVFWQGQIEFWSVSKGHHADVGGSGVAGYNPGARSIWEECIRIPPAKLYAAGQLNRALLDTILLNVHLPFLVEGDLHCQVGAVTIGERNLQALLGKYGPQLLQAAIGQIFAAAERQMRAVIRGLPNGEFSGARCIDHDGINKDQMITVRVTLRIEDEAITFDFSASDPQAVGYVNSTLPNTASSAFLALFMSVGSGVRCNEGSLRALRVLAPPGSIVNANEPAPVTGCTIAAAQAIIEAVWLALAEAVPEQVDACWARWCAPATMGFNPRTGRFFGDIHFMSKGGAGAAYGFDGWDHLGTVICAGGLRSPDPELHELVTPYTVLQYEFRPDSAGAGQWRGGMGTIYRWRVDADNIAAANFGGGNRPETAPFGLAGGKAAPPHELYLRKGDQIIDVDTESFYSLAAGDIFEIYQSGGGGYGDPRRRPVESVRDDVLDGLVSVERARLDYGVSIDPDTLAVDAAETAQLRHPAGGSPR